MMLRTTDNLPKGWSKELASFISRFTLLQFTNLKKHEKAMPFGV